MPSQQQVKHTHTHVHTNTERQWEGAQLKEGIMTTIMDHDHAQAQPQLTHSLTHSCLSVVALSFLRSLQKPVLIEATA